MSRTAKTVFTLSLVACVTTIWGVHYMQRQEAVVRPPHCSLHFYIQ